LGKKIGKTVQPSGLIICEDYPFLACSPDGLLDDDIIVEIKCPYNARNVTPLEAATEKIIKYVTIEDSYIKLNKNCDYYYQIQGQLFITKRKYCLFCIWTPKGLHVEEIPRDELFFKKQLIKLESFYKQTHLEEIIKRENMFNAK